MGQMTIWDWAFIFYVVAAFVAGGAWLWATREKPLTKPFKTFDAPCRCEHPVKCDFYDRCMKNEHS
jgi:hypothetical protein